MKSSREAILEKVTAAVQHSGYYGNWPADAERKVADGLKAATPSGSNGLAEQFKKEIEKVSGECYIVDSEEEIAAKMVSLLQEMHVNELALDGHPMSRRIGSMVGQLMQQLKLLDMMTQDYASRRTSLANSEIGLVTADYGISDAGTLVAIYDNDRSNMAHFLPSIVFTLLRIDHLYPNLFELLASVDKDRAKNMVLITGPSRTADIEKILILGAHGPKRLVVFIHP